VTRTLRPYQLEACDAIRDAWAGGMLRPAIVMATGLGKTDIVAALAAERVRAGAAGAGPGAPRGAAQPDHRPLPDAPARRAAHGRREGGGRPGPAQPADRRGMVQTLRSKRRRDRFEPFGPGDLVVVDEGHHAGAKSYVDILSTSGRSTSRRGCPRSA
jgi:hypothetical protein